METLLKHMLWVAALVVGVVGSPMALIEAPWPFPLCSPRVVTSCYMPLAGTSAPLLLWETARITTGTSATATATIPTLMWSISPTGAPLVVRGSAPGPSAFQPIERGEHYRVTKEAKPGTMVHLDDAASCGIVKRKDGWWRAVGHCWTKE